MKRIFVLAALMAAGPSFAQDQPASEASVRELMTITNSKALLDQAYGQLDGVMEKAMKDAMAGKSGTPEQEKLLAEMRSKMVALFRENMNWDQLEPSYMKLYTSTFSQAEVDGMNAFYKSEAGQAVIGKMPQLMQSIMQLVMERMQAVIPKIRELEQEYKAKLQEAGK